MIYDLHSELQRSSFETKVAYHLKRREIVELKRVSCKRTTSQNSYLHLLLSYFALQVGEDLESVKQDYYKREANSELYVRTRNSKLRGRKEYLRSSSDLTVEEMTLSIERFRNWSAQVAGVYLPSTADRDALFEIEREVRNNKQYL